ncbi:MAG: hypothetical protein LBK42_02830 [Propionibacteriaceae bacterium]|jgi:hypothetical protein|nr:hypothetical protein [Propionibacteriaceae bacterium]
MADLITPQVISSSPDRYAGLAGQIALNYNSVRWESRDTVEASQGGVDQFLDERQPWYEKLLNGVGGAAVAVVEGVVVAPLEELFGATVELWGTGPRDGLENLRDMADGYVVENWVTNEEWYFGGRGRAGGGGGRGDGGDGFGHDCG